MSRFFLHLRFFDGYLHDDVEGSEHSSLIEAKREAELTMIEFVAEAIKRGDDVPCKVIVIADETGAPIVGVPFMAALPPKIVALIRAPEVVIPQDRLTEYRQFADDCRAKAEGTDNIEDKMSWLRLANAWLLMLPPDRSQSPDLSGWPGASNADSKASH